MRIVDVRKAFENNGVKFQAGKSYVMAEDVESQYRSVSPDTLGMSYPIEKLYKPYKGEDLNGKKLLGFRTGGVGDIFFVNPVLKYLKKKYPSSSIRFASACKYALENLPELDGVYDMPFDAKLLQETDYAIMFQGIIEAGSEESKRTHAVDMFFSYFGIDSTHLPAEDKVPRLSFTQGEMDWLAKTTKAMGIRDEDYVVAVQMESSSPLRNYPKEKMKAFVDMLAQEPDVKVVMVGSTDHDLLATQYFQAGNPKIIPATKFSVRQSIILTIRYNLVIAPDSFMIQAAGALDKPLIGLYGPFPSEVRMKYFKNAIGLDPAVVCGPCYKHDFRACVKGFPSPCFTLVSHIDVLLAADLLRHKFTGTHFGFMRDSLREPNIEEAKKFMLGADKGLCFFPGLYRHPNAIHVDDNALIQADITDLSTEFKRDSFPFVLYMNDFSSKHQPVYSNCKNMVRPGGYFIVYKRDSTEQLYQEVKRDVGGQFTLLHTKFNPGSREMLVIARRPF